MPVVLVLAAVTNTKTAPPVARAGTAASGYDTHFSSISAAQILIFLGLKTLKSDLKTPPFTAETCPQKVNVLKEDPNV